MASPFARRSAIFRAAGAASIAIPLAAYFTFGRLGAPQGQTGNLQQDVTEQRLSAADTPRTKDKKSRVRPAPANRVGKAAPPRESMQAPPEVLPHPISAIEPEPSGTSVASEPPALPNRPVVEPALARTRLVAGYVPGQRPSWMPYDVTVDVPLVVRAAGQVSIDDDISGPNGLPPDAGEPKGQASRRVFPAAPYLALIGRLCSDELCSEPFLIGSEAVLCPSNVAPAKLQLWTNNEIRVDGIRSLRRYSGTVGGYTVEVSRERGNVCGAPSATSPRSRPAPALTSGQILRGPDFAVSSSQAWWKPFFVPVGQPVRIRASGSIWGRGHGPVGPAGAPATGEHVSEAEPRLDDKSRVFPALPDRALIGRLCGQEQCGPVFLVGSDKTICPAPALDDHLELWINHAVSTRGRLGGGSLPVTADMFELQTRYGEYRVEVSQAPDQACRTTTR